MKLINGQFYNVSKQRYTGITAKKTRGRWQYRDVETNKLYASGMTNGSWGMTARHKMTEKIVGNYWTAEPIEEPWELQDAEDALVPLEPGESFNYIGAACFIVLAAFGGILWLTM